MAKTTFKWSDGNTKLQKTGTVGFSIPAFRSLDGFVTCPGAGACASVCYARQGFFTFPGPRLAMEWNLSMLRNTTPAEAELLLTLDLARIAPTTVRIHPSGDFFSQDYFDMWYNLARMFRHVRFYAYTKSLHLKLRSADNFVLTKSFGGRYDSKIKSTDGVSKIFATEEQRKAEGFIDGNTNDLPAIRGEKRIGLVYHGSRKLKPEEALRWDGIYPTT